MTDYIIIFSIIMFIGAHTATNFIIAYHRDTADSIEDANAVMQVMEQNPVARYFLLAKNLNILFSYVVVPAFILATYMAFRLHPSVEPWVLVQVAWIFFFAAFIDVTNDISILLGLWLK